MTFPIIAGVALPAPGEHASFGEVTGDLEETQVLRVLSIEPGDDLTATLTLVDDAPAINDADKGVIPISMPMSPSRLTRSISCRRMCAGLNFSTS